MYKKQEEVTNEMSVLLPIAKHSAVLWHHHLPFIGRVYLATVDPVEYSFHYVFLGLLGSISGAEQQ